MASARTVLCIRLALAAVMAFIAGWVDIVCMTRYSAFATMMTGNVLYLGKTVISRTPTTLWSGPVFYLLLIFAYISGLEMHQLVERRFKHKTAMLFAPVLAAGVVAVELLDNAFAKGHLHWYNQKVSVIFLAPLFAAQGNIALRGGLGTVTSMATGHIHSLTHWLVQACFGELSADNKRKIPMSIFVIFFLIAGAVSGAELIRANKDPPQCSLQPLCKGLDGDCCPTVKGVYLECCLPDDVTEWMLLPCGPVLALALVIHDVLFWPRPPKEQQQEHLLGEVQMQMFEERQVVESQMVQSQTWPPPTASAPRGSWLIAPSSRDLPPRETMLHDSPIAMSGMGESHSLEDELPSFPTAAEADTADSPPASSLPKRSLPPWATMRDTIRDACRTEVEQHTDDPSNPPMDMD